MGEGFRLSPDGLDACFEDQVDAWLDEGGGHNGRSAGDEPGDPGGRADVRVETERVVAALPAGHRVDQFGAVMGYVDEGGSSGPTVQVLVGASDSQVRLGRAEVDGHHPDRVGQVPEDKRACGVGGGSGGR